jgi:hypothetical protein
MDGAFVRARGLRFVFGRGAASKSEINLKLEI